MDAVVIMAYKSPIIKKTVDSLVKYTPRAVPIYLLDQAHPSMVEEKKRMRDAAEPYGDRVKVVEYYINERIAFAPWAMVNFLEDNPDIDRVVKVDDDVIFGSEFYFGLAEAYGIKSNVLFVCAICPIQIWGLQILVDRCGIKVDDRLLNPEIMLDTIVHNPHLATEVWEQTTPPSKILDKLRVGDRFVEVPLFRASTDSRDPSQRADFMINQYLAHRDVILYHCRNLNGINTSDEINYQRTRQRSGRPVIMDTWSLAYHFSGAPWAGYAMDNHYPMIKDIEF